jgi:hypothetical protein
VTEKRYSIRSLYPLGVTPTTNTYRKKNEKQMKFYFLFKIYI